MPAFPLLWPVIAQAGLTFVVWLVLLVQRARYLKTNPPGADDFATGASARAYFEPVELPAANLANLFELPVLFFVVALLLLQTELANDVQVVLAWVYVALRVLHSYVHIVLRRVPLRAGVYALSVAVLMAMWIGFAVDAATAQHAYDETMATLEAQAPQP